MTASSSCGIPRLLTIAIEVASVRSGIKCHPVVQRHEGGQPSSMRSHLVP